MTQHNARLLNEPRLRLIVTLTDDLADHGQEIADALSDYESAGELAGDERSEGREIAREAFVGAMEALLATAAAIKAEYERAVTEGQEFAL